MKRSRTTSRAAAMKNDRVLPPGKVLPPLHGGTASAEQGHSVNQVVGPSEASGRPGPRYPKPLSRGGRKPSAKGAGKSDRFYVLNDFVDVSMRDLSNAALRAWLVLYRDTKPNGLTKTGLTDLARRAGFSHRTARRAVEQLRSRGLVKVFLRGRKGAGPSVYRVVGVGDAGDAD